MSKFKIPEISNITVDGQVIDINHLLSNEYDDVAVAAVEIPATIEYLNQMLQYYSATENVEKHAIKEAEARAYMRLRSGSFIERYGDKMTEKALEHAVALDEDVKKAIAAHADCDAWVDRLRNTIRVLLVRLEFIRTVEATRRHADSVAVR